MSKLISILLTAIMLVISPYLFADDEFITYRETFTHLGPEGGDPEVVFADIIPNYQLNTVKGCNELFYFDGYKWVNEIGKIKNGMQYIIQIKYDGFERKHKNWTEQISSRKPTMIVVDINGTGNYTSIQEGIDNSINGDTILAYPGTYLENITYKGKNITLASLYLNTQDKSYIDSTVIDSNQNGSVVTFVSGEDTTAVLCGFTIQNGSGTYNLHNIRGGGIFCIYSNPKLVNCKIQDNNAELSGDIHCKYSILRIAGTTIRHNHAIYD